jgi:hypothetical protein
MYTVFHNLEPDTDFFGWYVLLDPNTEIVSYYPDEASARVTCRHYNEELEESGVPFT